MVFKDPYKEKELTYQYCEWPSAPDELLKEEIKSIFNDMQLVIQGHGWIQAHGIVLELGKKQFQESWDHCERTRQHQTSLLESTQAERN